MGFYLKIVVNQETGTIFFSNKNMSTIQKGFCQGSHFGGEWSVFEVKWSHLKFWISKWFFESICGPASYAEKPVKCRCNNVDKTQVINFRDKSCNFGRDWLRIIRIILSAVLCCIAVLSPNWFRHIAFSSSLQFLIYHLPMLWPWLGEGNIL